MSLAKQFESELGAATAAPCGVVAQEGDLQVSCALEQISPLACGFHELVLRTGRLTGSSVDDLQKISEDLAARLTYLMEPIGPVERDQDQCVVQMRSLPPTQGDDGTRYYELLVTRSELSLRRYEKKPGDPRQTIAATVTREVLLRLVEDLAAVVP